MTSRNTESRIREALETDPPLNPREEEEVTDPLLGPAGAGSPQAMMTGAGDGEKNRPIGKTIVTED